MQLLRINFCGIRLYVSVRKSGVYFCSITTKKGKKFSVVGSSVDSLKNNVELLRRSEESKNLSYMFAVRAYKHRLIIDKLVELAQSRGEY